MDPGGAASGSGAPTPTPAPHAKATRKARKLEEKRAAGAVACAECRRLKLKCSREIPCASCTRRGCDSICPHGTLVSGHGTRMLRADTEVLHARITQMSERIRALEEAVAVQQARVSAAPHALLRHDLLEIKSTLELHNAVDTGGGGGGAGASASASASGNAGQGQGQEAGPSAHAGAGDGLTAVPSASPSPPLSAPAPTYAHLRAQLPPWPRAQPLAALYADYQEWLLGFADAAQLRGEILPFFYAEARGRGDADSQHMATDEEDGEEQDGDDDPHLLALLFAVLAVGALFSPLPPSSSPSPFFPSPASPASSAHLPPIPLGAPGGEHYYALARAALDLRPPLDSLPTLPAVQALSILAFLPGMIGWDDGGVRHWSHFALAGKLVQSMELHRDPARKDLPRAEVQKRRAFFWAWQLKDCWICMGTDRIPTFPAYTIDCQLPEYDGSFEGSFSAWKHRFASECLTEIACAVTTERPSYRRVLALTEKLFALPFPACSAGSLAAPPRAQGISPLMRFYMPMSYREFAYFYLHRTFFAQAMLQSPADPMQSRFATSFITSYHSACKELDLLKDQVAEHPAALARMFWCWHRGFTSAVMVGAVAMLGPDATIAASALHQLRQACALFEQAKPYGGLSGIFLPGLQRMYDKAWAIMNRATADPSARAAITSIWQLRENRAPASAHTQFFPAVIVATGAARLKYAGVLGAGAGDSDDDDNDNDNGDALDVDAELSDGRDSPVRSGADEEDPDIREVWHRFLEELEITPKVKEAAKTPAASKQW